MILRAFAALAVLLLALFAAREMGGQPRIAPMRFAAPPDGPLAFRGALALRPEGGLPAGLSGAVWEGDRRILAISDKGYWARLDLSIDDGWLTGARLAETAPLLTHAGVPAVRDLADAEGLARDPATGRLWVSFEQIHRVWRYPATDARPDAALADLRWMDFDDNGGLEGLARDGRGRLWAFAERGGPAWVLDGGAWRKRAVPRDAGWAVTGADFGPEGRLYLTERAFSPFAGFHFRLRRLTFDAAGAVAGNETLLTLPAQSFIDNIETVALRAEGARTWLLILSDDNDFALQRNVIALFEVLG